MKTLVWVLVILNGSEIISDDELTYPSLQKCEIYEHQINRAITKTIAGYPYGAYCRPEVADRPDE